jgi:hypothetical protein
MTRLSWDKRDCEYGLDRGVLYPQNAPGVVWNGLSAVDVEDTSSEGAARYIDGVKTYRNQQVSDLKGSVSAYTYPQALDQKPHDAYGFSYRVTKGDRFSIHLVYNSKFSPGGISRQTFETEPFRWNFSSLPPPVPYAKRTAHLIVDTSQAYSWTVAELESTLYGSDAGAARLPTPTEIFQIFEDNSILQIIDHDDGTWTAIGPDSVVSMLDSTTFQIDWPSAVYVSADKYTVHSL